MSTSAAVTAAYLVVVAVSLAPFASAQLGSCSPQFRSLALAAEANNETNCINFGIICANQSTTGGNRTAGPCLHVLTGVCLPFQHESARVCWQGTSACNLSLSESYCADATPGPPPSLQPTHVLIQECPDNWASLCQFSCETVSATPITIDIKFLDCARFEMMLQFRRNCISQQPLMRCCRRSDHNTSRVV